MNRLKKSTFPRFIRPITECSIGQAARTNPGNPLFVLKSIGYAIQIVDHLAINEERNHAKTPYISNSLICLVLDPELDGNFLDITGHFPIHLFSRKFLFEHPMRIDCHIFELRPVVIEATE